MKSERVQSRQDTMAWVVCLSAGLFFFYEFFQLNLFDVINQPLRDDFHLDATQLSWMSSSYLWANILFLLPAGFLLDRFSTRRVILYAMLVCIFGTLGFALTHSFSLGFLFHFLSGIGNAFCFLACVVLISHWFPPKRQAFVIGLMVTMAFIGGMMAHTPFAWLNAMLGWRMALFVDGLVGIVLWFLIFANVKDRPDTSRVHKTTPRLRKKPAFLSVLINRQNWFAGFYTAFLNLPIMVLCALWGANYLKVVHHLPELAASNVVSLIFIGSMIGCPLAGFISDRTGRRKPLMIVGACLTLLVLIPLFLPWVLTQFQLSLVFFALGLFTSTQVISYPLVAESNAQENTGAATAVASFIIMGGGGCAQILFGWLMQQHVGAGTQAYRLVDYQFAMGMFPVAAALALLAVCVMRETFCRRQA